ncbi:DUF3858 domain-containing protein [Pedobacter sp. L105]|uniref:DUF3858 domain-containing protein n=1 Tax=Pedobacter sp. L105 TaxID=1641871 RepID=UPI00131B10D2|nr:DUF3858 domain-containing protein [Pedobacter sp. L105]
MYKLYPLFLIILLSGILKLSAQSLQSPDPKTFKFGKVTQEEFDTKATGADSSAAAIKLFDIGTGYFEVSHTSGALIYAFERRVRYKILSKNGYNLADLEISLYNNDKGYEEKLSTLTGATYNLSGSNIIVSKMNSDAKFSSRRDKNHTVKKFTLPNVKEGSIIEYSYKTVSDFIYQLDDWYFQSRYPCKYSSFTITIPQYYNYKISAGGYINIQQDKPAEVSQLFYIPSDQMHPVASTVNALALKTHYYAQNVPAIKDESYITTISDYISRIGFELNTVRFPNADPKDYNSTWPKIIAEMMVHEHFGGFIKNNGYADQLVKGILQDEKDPDAQMNLIFNYVKNNIKWNGTYNDYTEVNDQKTVLEKKSGNSAEINLILLNLLTTARLESYPVLLSTRNNGTHPGYPLLSKFNTLIIQVEIDGKKHLLDATDKNNSSDLLSYQDLNHKGLKLNLSTNEGEWIFLETSKPNISSTRYNLLLNTENKLTGSLLLSASNYKGLNRRKAYQEAASQEEFIKTYKSSKTGLNISNYSISNLTEPIEPLIETMDVDIEDNIEEAGKLVYFNPLLFQRTKENPFNLEERNFPVDFAYPFDENYSLILDFPANYQLDKLPKNEKFVLPDAGGSFMITYTAEGNKIAIISKLNISKPIFSANEYYTLKELYKNIVRKQGEQIVFKKP